MTWNNKPLSQWQHDAWLLLPSGHLLHSTPMFIISVIFLCRIRGTNEKPRIFFFFEKMQACGRIWACESNGGTAHILKNPWRNLEIEYIYIYTTFKQNQSFNGIFFFLIKLKKKKGYKRSIHIYKQFKETSQKVRNRSNKWPDDLLKKLIRKRSSVKACM